MITVYSTISKVDMQRRQLTLGHPPGGAFKCINSGVMFEGDTIEVMRADDPFAAFGSFALFSQSETACDSCKCTVITSTGPLPGGIAVGDSEGTERTRC